MQVYMQTQMIRNNKVQRNAGIHLTQAHGPRTVSGGSDVG